MTARSLRGKPALVAAGVALAVAIGGVSFLEVHDPRDRYESLIRSDRPLAYWRVGGQTGRTGADEAGDDDIITFHGASLGTAGAISGSANTAIGFDGYDDYAILGRRFGFSLRTPFSLEVWVRPTVPAERQPSARILTKEYDDRRGRRHGYALWLDPQAGVVFERLEAGVSQSVRAPVALPVDTYSHLVATFDGRRMALYVDGRLADTAVHRRPVPVPEHNVPLTAGRSLGVTAGRYWGLMDEIAIYDRPLAPSEVREHFAAAR